MTREDFKLNAQSQDGFNWAMSQLAEEHDCIWDIDGLKGFLIHLVRDEDWMLLSHLADCLNLYGDAEWFDYDACMGTMNELTPIKDISDVEYYLEEDEDEIQ